MLDLDTTDLERHGGQEGRFFHGYYDEYCYLPLYIFCGEHVLCARLRQANIDAAAGSRQEVERVVQQIRARWPQVRIVHPATPGRWCFNRPGRICAAEMRAAGAPNYFTPASQPPGSGECAFAEPVEPRVASGSLV